MIAEIKDMIRQILGSDVDGADEFFDYENERHGSDHVFDDDEFADDEQDEEYCELTISITIIYLTFLIYGFQIFKPINHLNYR